MKMYTMKETCEATGLSYETLKFYCREGLIPCVGRDKNNHRIFDEAMVAWIKDLQCLKRCNMSLVEMKEYFRLCLEGPKSIEVRQDMLTAKRKELEEQIEILKGSLAYIDWKMNFYDDIKTGKKPYVSNLFIPEADTETKANK